MTDRIPMAVTETRRRLVRPAALLACLLLCVGLAGAWRFWPSPQISASADRDELNKALFLAIRDGDHARVQDLLGQGADVEARDEAGESALMQAGLNADVAMMRLLLQHEADPNARNRNGVPVLLRAAHDPDKVRLLLYCGARIEDRAVVVAALVPGSRKTLELLLQRGGSARAEVAGYTALMAAAGSGDLESVTCLVEHGADVTARTSKGYTALLGAASSGNASIVDLLLDRGADPNARYEPANEAGDFETPALAAALQGHVDCLKRLLDRGADVNAQGGPFDRTPLICAATRGNEETVRLLLAKGADLNAKDWRGDTALAWARRRGETAIVKLLQQAGQRDKETGRQGDKDTGRQGDKQTTTVVARSPDRATGWSGREAAPQQGDPLSPGGRGVGVRGAIAASLPLLQQSGQKIIHGQGCITCHQHSLVAMTLGLVRKHGVAVDEDTAARARSQVVTLLGQRIPRILLGADLDPTLAAYTLAGMAAEDEKPNALSDALVHYLVLRQSIDGRWLVEGYRPPEDGSDFLFTALAVRGLQVYAPKGRSKEIAARLARARTWLLEAKPEETVDRVYQLLGLHWLNAGTEPVQKAAGSLLAEQREDGGWPQLPSLKSDAYATGQALCALHEATGLPVDTPAFQRGVDFLLRTRLASGSWYVPTRSFPVVAFSNSGFPHGRSQFISAAATCWATMALSLTLPSPEG
jgi:ankyrin repeat protein